MPEAIHPQTKTEDYLAAMYHTGWLVFETKAEDEKRRLADFPLDWSELRDRALRVLLGRAEIIPPRKLRDLREARGEEAARQQERAVQRAKERADLPEEERRDITDLGVVRTFRYPGGRYWIGVSQRRKRDCRIKSDLPRTRQSRLRGATDTVSRPLGGIRVCSA